MSESSALPTPRAWHDIEALARAIAGEDASRARDLFARQIAAAQRDLDLVRRVRQELLSAAAPRGQGRKGFPRALAPTGAARSLRAAGAGAPASCDPHLRFARLVDKSGVAKYLQNFTNEPNRRKPNDYNEARLRQSE